MSLAPIMSMITCYTNDQQFGEVGADVLTDILAFVSLLIFWDLCLDYTMVNSVDRKCKLSTLDIDMLNNASLFHNTIISNTPMSYATYRIVDKVCTLQSYFS